MTCCDIPRYDICDIKKGATYNKTFAFSIENQVTGDSQVVDFSAVVAAQMQIREKKSSANTIIDLSLGNGLIINTTFGLLTIEIDASTTANIAEGYGEYDVFFTYSDGTVERVLEGKVIFIERVTR